MLSHFLKGRKIVWPAGIAVALALAALCSVWVVRPDLLRLGSGRAAEPPAPDFALERMGGEMTRLSDFRGKTVLLAFWTAQMPKADDYFAVLESVRKKFADKNVEVIAVHRTRTELRKTAEDFAGRSGGGLPVLFDVTDEVYQTIAGAGSALPVAVFVDRRGAIRERQSGFASEDDLSQKLTGSF